MNKQEFLEQAIKLTTQKMRVSVIPVAKDKKPMIDWKEYQTRIATENEIKQWANFPDVQLGIVTGKISNLTVVDVEKGGDASMLPQNTTIVETGGGGAHFYYNYCPEVRNKARVLDLIDIRSEGGYVVAPGSETFKGKYTVVQKAPLIDFPLSIVANVTRDATLLDKSGYLSGDTSTMEYPGYGAGSRNQEMTKFVGHVLTRVHPARWDTEALKIIAEANSKNTPPLNDREIMTIFNSIKETEIKNNPRRWENRNTAVAAQDPKREWDEAEKNGEGTIQLMSEVARAQHISIENFSPLGMDIFDKEIMGGAIPGDVIVIAGQPGAGKTTLAMNLARNFIKEEGSVLFFSYEVLVQFVWDKFKTMGMKDEDLLFCPFKNVTGNVEWIERKIKEAKSGHNVKFVVIDHLGFLAPKMKGISNRAMENYSIYLTSIMRELKTIAKNEEIVIVLPAHMRKREASFRRNTEVDINDIQHSNGIAQESDLVFIVQRELDTRKGATDMHSGYSLISLAKNRRGSKNPKGYFTLVNEAFVYDDMYGGIATQGDFQRKSYPSTSYTEPKGEEEDDIDKLI